MPIRPPTLRSVTPRNRGRRSDAATAPRVRSNPVTTGDLEQLELNPDSLDQDMNVILRIATYDALAYARAEENLGLNPTQDEINGLREIALRLYEDACYGAALFGASIREFESREDALAYVQDAVKRAVSMRAWFFRSMEVAKLESEYEIGKKNPFASRLEDIDSSTAIGAFEKIVVMTSLITNATESDELVADTWLRLLNNSDSGPRIQELRDYIREQGRETTTLLLQSGNDDMRTANRDWVYTQANKAFREAMGRPPLTIEAVDSQLATLYDDGIAEVLGADMGRRAATEWIEENGAPDTIEDANDGWEDWAYDSLNDLRVRRWQEETKQVFIDSFIMAASNYASSRV